MIYPVYFSCNSHFEYLILSLKSMKLCDIGLIEKIYLHIDKDDYLSNENIKILNDIGYDIIYKKSGKITGWGKKTIENEITNFNEIAGEINSDDWICKLDSDILFLSHNIFKHVLKSDSDMVGNPRIKKDINYKFPQGGCYFLRAKVVNKLNITDDVINKVLNIINYKGCKNYFAECPEDIAIYNLALNNNFKIEFNEYYGSEKHPDFNKSVSHFEGLKQNMPKFYKFLEKRKNDRTR